VKEIALTQGKIAIVDDADYDELARYKWCVIKDRNGSFYAVRRDYSHGIPGRMVYMHRVITKAPKRTEVHHVSHDTLDNRRCNLQVLTRKQHYAIHGNGDRHRKQKEPKPHKEQGKCMNGDLNCTGVAALVGLSRQRVNQIARKRGIGQQIGKLWHFTPADIEIIQFVRGVVKVQQEA
jgi:hypothetical protein